MSETSVVRPSTAAATKSCISAAGIFTGIAILVLAVFSYAAGRSNAFLVVTGSLRDGGIVRTRNCIGFLWEAEMRDGVEKQCVGIPAGPWRCFKVVPDEPAIRIPCVP